jgi:peroxidase
MVSKKYARKPLELAGFVIWVLFGLCVSKGSAQLSQNFYAATCPNVESIVRNVVSQKFAQTFVTIPATLRLFFHDCFVEGCDASVTIQSTPENTAEKDYTDNLSLAGDGFDTVIKAKQAVENVCPNKVSCADILTMAARDVVELAGGPEFNVELGRRDGMVSLASNVPGNLPEPTFNLNQLNTLFRRKGLNQTDMIALSGAHTVGFSHCSKFADRIYNFSRGRSVDPSLDPAYATQLQQMCPRNVDPTIAINMDPITPNTFDNAYYEDLQSRKGLFTSDEVLFTDTRSRSTVNTYAQSPDAFNTAFVNAMIKLGRVGVKTGTQGQIRLDCTRFN